MRLTALTGLLFLLTAAPAGAQEAPPPVEARMPLDLYREEGQPVQMGSISIVAGQYESQFLLNIGFIGDGTALGPPWAVFGQVALGDYCRNEDSEVRAALTSNSTGQVWTGRRIAVRAGPRGNQRWAQGFSDDPDLFAALAAGGIVTLALQDDEGRLWNAVTIDILSPAERDKLHAINLEVVRTTDPSTVPVVGPPPPLQLVERAPAPRTPPPPPQSCP